MFSSVFVSNHIATKIRLWFVAHTVSTAHSLKRCCLKDIKAMMKHYSNVQVSVISTNVVFILDAHLEQINVLLFKNFIHFVFTHFPFILNFSCFIYTSMIQRTIGTRLLSSHLSQSNH